MLGSVFAKSLRDLRRSFAGWSLGLAGYVALIVAVYPTIRDNPDQLSLFIGVEWLFNAHRAGFVVHDRAEDRRLAHAYAEQYLKAGGLNEPLVKQWLGYLDKE